MNPSYPKRRRERYLPLSIFPVCKVSFHTTIQPKEGNRPNNYRGPEPSENLPVLRPPSRSCWLGAVSLEDSRWKQRSLSSESEIMRPLVCDCSLHIRQRPCMLWRRASISPCLALAPSPSALGVLPCKALMPWLHWLLCERELGKLAAPGAREGWESG